MHAETMALERGTPLPLERERVLAAMLGIPALIRHPVWRRADPEQGRGRGVVLIPGFGVGGSSLALVHSWLAARGYKPAGARIGLNVGCTTDLVKRLERRVKEMADRTGRRVVLLGQSRGGWLGRLVAVRRPELVRGLVMAGSPVLDPLGAHSKVVRVAQFLARLSAMGVPGLLNAACLSGDCMRTHRAALGAALPVPALAVYSRQDAIVPWELCLDPCAECVEVSSSHTGMALDPAFFAAVQPKLAEWA
ncbi:alpha/beta fold hydrolase [Actinokineospora sp. UTMC 2448]|uniref:alpha/beta fold hydrolase n=1 Tax=Actinokineospora sp. UTMC 2448 TaxID=2268449 RepID=UPI0022098ED4|nr:Alpha/beta hydrolase family protein [Actinokineospora sp. UTMC 2448]